MRVGLFTLLASATALAAGYLWFRTGVWVSPGAVYPWLPLGTAVGASSLCGAIVLQLAGRWNPERPLPAGRAGLSPGAWRSGMELTVVVASLALPPLLDGWELPLTFALFGLLAVRMYKGDRLDQLAVVTLIGADFAVEAILVYRGAYYYRHASVAPLPLWLPAVWANLALCVRRLFPLLPRNPRK
jgi:hypothetical protein